MSSSFPCSRSSSPIVVLGGAFKLVHVFYSFKGSARNTLCMNFTISPFDNWWIPYLIYHAMLIIYDLCIFSGRLALSLYNDKVLF